MTGVEFVILIPFLLQFKNLDIPSRCLFYYILSSLVFAGGSAILQHLSLNNMWFFSLMHFIQFVILSIFYRYCIKNPVVKNIILFVPIAVLAIFIFDLFYIEGPRAYNSISSGVKHVVLITYGIYLFMQMLRDKELIENAVYINTLPEFWYNAAIFVFACTEFFFSISYNYLQSLQTSGPGKMKTTMAILSINYIVGMVSMILLYIGLTKLKKTRYANS